MPEPTVVSVGRTAFKVRLLGADTFPTALATNMAITSTEHEVTVAFYEALLPMGPEAMADTKEVPARCVARIVIPAGRFKEIADLWRRVSDQRDLAHQPSDKTGEPK